MATRNAEAIHVLVRHDIFHAMIMNEHFIVTGLSFCCGTKRHICLPGGVRIRAASFMFVVDESPTVKNTASRATVNDISSMVHFIF